MVAEDPGREFEELWEGTQERLRERLEWMDLDMESQKIRSSRYRRDMDRYGHAGKVMPEFGWRPSSS
jgi:hypothetical protein